MAFAKWPRMFSPLVLLTECLRPAARRLAYLEKRSRNLPLLHERKLDFLVRGIRHKAVEFLDIDSCSAEKQPVECLAGVFVSRASAVVEDALNFVDRSAERDGVLEAQESAKFSRKKPARNREALFEAVRV